MRSRRGLKLGGIEGCDNRPCVVSRMTDVYQEALNEIKVAQGFGRPRAHPPDRRGARGGTRRARPGRCSTGTWRFDILLDPVVVSDDELAAALHHQGYDLTSWQEVRAMHAVQQRTWLLEQIRSLASRTALELAERGAYADGVTKGSVDAYVRTARAFGLVSDAEIVELIPARSLEGPTDG
jgi:hypothetical protein